jgi:nanoRNase/pAp phosphatase (c-di-AMP/oligoRNAs hydrolase)
LEFQSQEIGLSMQTLTTKIVLPPTPPDLDGVACAIAYAELLNRIGVRALAWFSGQPDAEARYVLSQCKGVVLAEHQTVVEADEYILVDGRFLRKWILRKLSK